MTQKDELFENRADPGADGTVRKAHYGDGEQPWDVAVRLGWGPVAAAFCVLRYLRRDKAIEHSRESARWYYARLVDGASREIDDLKCFQNNGPWTIAFHELETELTVAELRIARGVEEEKP